MGAPSPIAKKKVVLKLVLGILTVAYLHLSVGSDAPLGLGETKANVLHALYEL